jgi:hypothetical protein
MTSYANAMSGFVVDVAHLPGHVLQVLELYRDVPDSLFIIHVNESMGMSMINGVPVIRDYEFADRWRSIFVKWTNMPSKASMSWYAIEHMIDHLVPYYANTWRTKKRMMDMYRDAFNIADKLRFTGTTFCLF